jgi:2-dehydro-3-deoxyphosphooctonate aldolase (KDO 8-P synthase)
MPKTITIHKTAIGNHKPLILIAGPCSLESRELVFSVAENLNRLKKQLGIQIIFKCSYDKANRSALKSYRGPGLKKGLPVLAEVKKKFGMPILIDVHESHEPDLVAQVADVLQIPAFLCRQTDLILAAARTGRVVNVKKGQFMAPWDIRRVIEKIESTGNRRILITERGASFGYNNLVVDMRGMEVMKSFGYPVIYDATHSVQLPGALGHASGGERQYIFPLARAATALGLAGLFMEVHPRPEKALSDGPNTVRLAEFPHMLKALMKIDALVKGDDTR